MIQNFCFRLNLILVALLAVLVSEPSRCCAQSGQDLQQASVASISPVATHVEAFAFDPGNLEPCEHCLGTGWAGEQPAPRFKLTEFNIYPTFSFLDDQVGNYCEFEFASKTQLGPFELENRTVMNVADLPGTIKLGAANPDLGPSTLNVRGNGFGDILSGFFFSRKSREKESYLGVGAVVTMPTASNELLGSDQWTLGPGAHFSTEIGRLSTGFFRLAIVGIDQRPYEKSGEPVVWKTVLYIFGDRKMELDLRADGSKPFLEIASRRRLDRPGRRWCSTPFQAG